MNARLRRTGAEGMLALFDFLDPTVSRDVTNVPLQELFVLNSDFMVRQAKALAARLTGTGVDDASRVREAYLVLYGRPATDAEVQWGVEFVGATAPVADESDKKSSLTPWEQYAHVLLSANEFAYVD